MENIQVALRLRPLNKKELLRAEENIWEIPNMETVSLSTSGCRDQLAARKASGFGRSTFYYDQCFTPDHNNIQIYNQIVKRIVLSSLNGINGTIFMYGQTGSGKTYTMMGYNKHECEDNDTTSLYDKNVSPRNRSSTPPKRALRRSFVSYGGTGDLFESTSQNTHRKYFITEATKSTGILVLALRDIFETIQDDMDKTFFLKCSYIEIYNDQIYDLLKSAERLSETLTVNEDSQKDFYIKGVVEESVSSIEEILDKLRKGEANRHYARTTMNHASSRSHTIFRLTVQSVTNNFIREYRREKDKCTNINNSELRSQFEETYENHTKTEGTIVTESMLNFVDLAGSEKVSNHQMLLEESGIINNGETGGIYGRDSIMAVSKMKERVKEGQHINKSLFFLTQVISLKSEGKSNQHIPYRNSPLTKILRSSLGGNSRTLIVLCITPAASQFEQSMSTLRFGVNAKKIENRVQANIVTRDDDVGLKILISDYEKKLKDSETARLEEQAKYLYLIRQIDDLQSQKSTLVERINNLCKSRISLMAESVPEDDLASFYGQVKERNLYLDKVGVIFPCKSLNKYDDFTGSSAVKKSSQKKNRKQSTESNSKHHNEGEKGSSKKRKDKSRHQNSTKETLYVFYSKLCKVYREQNALLNKKVDVLSANGGEICERDVAHYDKYAEGSKQNKDLFKRLQQSENNYKRKRIEVSNLKKDVNLYRDLKGIADMDEKELGSLEKHFWERLDQIKMERAKRLVIKEMNLSKEIIEQHSLSREVRQKDQEADSDLSFDHNEPEDNVRPRQPDGDNLDLDREDLYEKEKAYIKEILSKGIAPIDKELEKTQKSLLEIRESFDQDLGETEKPPKSDKEERGNTRMERHTRGEKSASRSATPIRKNSNNANTGQSESVKNKSQKKQQPADIPKLDLGASLNNFVIEPDMQKISAREQTNQITSTRQFNNAEKPSSLKEIEVEEITSLQDRRRERSESRTSFVSSSNYVTRERNHNEVRNEGLDNSLNQINQVKTVLKTEPTSDTQERKQNATLNMNDTSSDKITNNVSAAQYYSAGNRDIQNLQESLTKHLASLEKYYSKPVLGSRRSKNGRSEQVVVTPVESSRTGPESISAVSTRGKDEGLRKRKKAEEGIEMRYESEETAETKSVQIPVQKPEVRREQHYIKDRGPMHYREEMENPCSNDVTNGDDMRQNSDIRDGVQDRFPLNLTNIEKEETMFSNSIFSVNGGEAAKEREYESYMESNVLKNLDNILLRGDGGLEMGEGADYPLNESKKRRKRADRLKKI